MTVLELQTILLLVLAYFIGAALACGLRRKFARPALAVSAPASLQRGGVAAVSKPDASAPRAGTVEPLPRFRRDLERPVVDTPSPAVAPDAPVSSIATAASAGAAGVSARVEPANSTAPRTVVAPPPVDIAPKPQPAPPPQSKAPLPPQDPSIARYPASTTNGNRFDDALAGKVAEQTKKPVLQPSKSDAPPAESASASSAGMAPAKPAVRMEPPKVVKPIIEPVAPPRPVAKPVESAPAAVVTRAPVETVNADTAESELPKVEAPKTDVPSRDVLKVETNRPTTTSTVVAGRAESIAAAAAAAAAAVAARTKAAAAAPVASPSEQRSVEAVKAVAGVPAKPSTSIVSANSTEPELDDLTLIANIDHATAARLVELGTTRYRQIVDWKSSDVKRINDALGKKSIVQQENWIEQAQLLAGGQLTGYARRMRNGERPLWVPHGSGAAPQPAVAPLPQAKSGSQPLPREAGRQVNLAPPPLAPRPNSQSGGLVAAERGDYIRQLRGSGSEGVVEAAAIPSPANISEPASSDVKKREANVAESLTASTVAGTSAVSAAAAAAAAAIAAAAAAPVRTSETVAARNVSAPLVEERAAFAAERRAADTSAAPVILSPSGKAVQSDKIVLPTVQRVEASAVSERDDLQRISGINAEIEKVLNGQGIHRYHQIASWQTSDVTALDRLLGTPGRIARENWIEQAQLLSRGGDTAYSREIDRQRSVTSPESNVSRSPRLAEAIRGNTQTAGVESGGREPRADLGALRSVRSERYQPAAEPAVVAASSAPATALLGTGTPRLGSADDLKRIRGIGVLIEKKLNGLGVATYEQIAQWNSADIEAVSQKLDFKGRIERENWIEQARILAAGGQTEFSRRVDRGEVDSSRKG